jgi:hypothetical protein
LRYFAGAVAFGFAAVWTIQSLAAAFVCLLSAAVGYGVVFVAEHVRAKRAVRAGSPGVSRSNTLSPPSRTAQIQDFPLRADDLNHDLGHVYEPSPTTPPPAAETEYGWPLNDATATPSDTSR